ncbi:MAG: hypothetical protein HY606_02095 [Planctomycetes bacterium]|nr:hypothetical protein [Planctomycetota bacterium]
MKKNLFKLFGTDGIRDLDSSGIFKKENIGKLVCATISSFRKLQGKAVNRAVIACDTRSSSPVISKRLREGLLNYVPEVVDLGIVPTPCLSYICKRWNCELGVMVTASHNPYYYNGIKFFASSGEKISESFENKIESLYDKLRFPCGKNKKSGLTDCHSKGLAVFFDKLNELGSTIRKKLVIDCANGIASLYARQILVNAGHEVRTKNDDVNKRPNFHCGAEYPLNLKKYQGESEIGVVYDGDMDRVLFLDEKGRLFDGDHIIALFAISMRKSGLMRKGSTVVLTTMANFGLEKFLVAEGFKVLRADVGDRYVLECMKQNDSILGGEQSGHIILRNIMPTGCGLTTTLFLLKSISNNRLSDYYGLVKKYPQKLVSIPVQKKIPLHSIRGFSRELDGINKMIDSNGRVVIRYSGTENKCRVMIECRDRVTLSKAINKMCSFIGKAGL